MPKTNFALWLDELRSGNRAQTKQRLRRDDRFCCLGVLCDISGLGDWDGNRYHSEEFGTEALPPKKVLLWLDPQFVTHDENVRIRPTCAEHLTLVQPEGSYRCVDGSCNNRVWDNISDLNDQGVSFEKIADVLEANYPELFVS